MSAFDVVEAQSFWDCVSSQRADDRYRGDLLDTMLELRRAPFQNPVLQSHKVGKAKNGRDIWSSDVGGRRSDRRVVWQLLGSTVVVLLYGTHAVQERAKRMRIDFDPADRVVMVYEDAPDRPGEERPYQLQRQVVGRLLMAWTDAELRAFGFPDQVVPVLRGLDSDDDLIALDGEMATVDFTRAFNLVAYGHPDGEAAVVAVDDHAAEAEAPEVTDADRDLELQLRDPRAGAWFTSTEPEYLKEILDAPIEDWMVFLHPDQRAAVIRRYDGPSRIRGAAGTGKTVVALHRAAELARRAAGDDRVLFLTVSDSLAPVLRHLFLRLKEAPADRVDFRSVGQLAAGLCGDAGHPMTASTDAAATAFELAHDEVVVPGSPLGELGLTREYLWAEIESVVRGRATRTLEEYLELDRRGRKVGLTERRRREVYRLHEEWAARQKEADAHLPVDIVLKALELAPLSAPRWAHAVVDEAQDLSMAALRLLERVVPVRGPDGLMLAGDGAQKVFTGGFTLAQAGLEVRGRTTVLRVNYRSTGAIMDLALAVAGADEVVDLDESFRRGEVRPESARPGDAPLLIVAPDRAGELAAAVDQIRTLEATARVRFGDIAVLEWNSTAADEVTKALTSAGVPVQPLEDYDGTTNDAVKVGTWPGAKGLEFKVVVIPGLGASQVPPEFLPGESDEEHDERRALELSRLFVAMTRARDALVLTAAGQPSELLNVDPTLLRREGV